MDAGRDPNRPRHPLGLMLCGGALLALVACESAPGPSSTASLPTGGGRYKVGSPYKIKGNWYRPEVNYGYDRTGIASWYGSYFHGRQTANGEIFDMNRISAAHPTLPMPSLVEVTNLQNGRKLRARVNDRGPFAHNRIIDMSRAAAEELGFRRQGTTRVRVRILPQESRQLAAAAKARRPEPVFDARPSSPAPVQAASGRSAPPIFAAPSQPTTGGSVPIPSSAPITAISSAELPPPSSAGGAAPRQVIAAPTTVATRQSSGFAPGVVAQQATPAPTTVAARQSSGLATGVAARQASAALATVPAYQASAFPPGVVARPASVATAPSTVARPRQAFAPQQRAAPAPKTVLARAGSRIFVQAGAYTDRGNAQRVRGRLANLGGASIESVMIGGRVFHRVRVGPAANQREADRLLSRVQGAGYSGAHLVVDRPL